MTIRPIDLEGAAGDADEKLSSVLFRFAPARPHHFEYCTLSRGNSVCVHRGIIILRYMVVSGSTMLWQDKDIRLDCSKE